MARSGRVGVALVIALGLGSRSATAGVKIPATVSSTISRSEAVDLARTYRDSAAVWRYNAELERDDRLRCQAGLRRAQDDLRAARMVRPHIVERPPWWVAPALIALAVAGLAAGITVGISVGGR